MEESVGIRTITLTFNLDCVGCFKQMEITSRYDKNLINYYYNKTHIKYLGGSLCSRCGSSFGVSMAGTKTALYSINEKNKYAVRAHKEPESRKKLINIIGLDLVESAEHSLTKMQFFFSKLRAEISKAKTENKMKTFEVKK